MKKLLLAAAVAAMGVSAAQAAPTLYGKLNVSIDQADNYDFKGNDVSEVSSHASRLGVKGEEKLTDNLSAVYQAEWAVSTDGSGSDTDWSARNRFIGLKWAGLGTLKAGSYDSYFKTAAGSAQDIFNDHTRLDITNMMHGEERPKNAIGIETDKKLLGGVQFNIMALQGENSTAPTTGTTGDDSARDGFGDGISASILYDNKDLGLSLGLAANSAVEGKFIGAGFDKTKVAADAFRITGAYDFSKVGINGLTLGGLWQTAEPSDDLTAAKGLQEDAFTIAAAYKIGSTPWVVKAEYANANTEYTAGTTSVDRDINQYGLGVDYQLNKQARMYGIVASQERDWKTAPGEDDTMTVFGVGMEYNF